MASFKEYIQLGDVKDKMTILAHFIIALANWTEIEPGDWTLDIPEHILFRRIDETLEEVLDQGSSNKVKLNKLVEDLEQASKLAERGGYVGEHYSLSKTLNQIDQTDQTVCLR